MRIEPSTPATTLLASLTSDATTISGSRIPELIARCGVEQSVIDRYVGAVEFEPTVARAFEVALGIKRLHGRDEYRIAGALKVVHDTMLADEFAASSGLEIL